MQDKTIKKECFNETIQAILKFALDRPLYQEEVDRLRMEFSKEASKMESCFLTSKCPNHDCQCQE